LLTAASGTCVQANTARLWSFQKKAKRTVNTEKVKQSTFGFYSLQGQSLALEIATSSEEEMLRVLPLITGRLIQGKGPSSCCGITCLPIKLRPSSAWQEFT